MNRHIFQIVRDFLIYISRFTGLTYNEINIIVYFFLIPFSWFILIDIIYGFHYFKLTFTVICLGFYFTCRDFESFSNRLFDKSVSFLNYFNNYGSNYVASSVWICVFLPIMIYGLLVYLIIKKNIWTNSILWKIKRMISYHTHLFVKKWEWGKLKRVLFKGWWVVSGI